IMARVRPLNAPRLGMRGLRRRRTLARHTGFRLLDPAIRYVGAWIAMWVGAARQQRIAARLQQAGDFLGLTPVEFVALRLVAAGLSTVFGLVLWQWVHLPLWLVAAFALLGAFLPQIACDEQRRGRQKAIHRTLPRAIDLLALCMGAGLDFVGAMRQLIQDWGNKHDPLLEELQRMLRELELGHTRKQCLHGLAQRVPSEPMRDFVHTVVQAEEKGNPLAEILEVQSVVLRGKRSVMAEEAAARAGVAMMGPMMMIVVCVLLIVMGPMVIQQMHQGF
ncbi:MAG: type II secretion system F family protein, partial [Polyangiales bacterium]